MASKSRATVLEFKKHVELLFGTALPKYGFELEVEHLHNQAAGIYFVKPNLQYIYIALNADQRDGPPILLVHVGVGPVKDVSWNAILLSEYIISTGRVAKAGKYKIQDFSDIGECIKQALNDLQSFGADFLEGNTLRALKAISKRAGRLKPSDRHSLEKINYYKNLYSETIKNRDKGRT